MVCDGVVVCVGVKVGVGVFVEVTLGVGVGVSDIGSSTIHPCVSRISIVNDASEYGEGTTKVYGNVDTVDTKTQVAPEQ